MRNFKKIKIKSHGFMLSLVVIGILGAAAFFSPAAFGPAVLDSKKDVIMTEASPPANVENEETTLKQNDEKNKNFFDPLTKEQAAPFIRIARETFVAQGMAPPETGYWISSTVTKGRNDVEISWYPNGVVFGQETKIKEKVYYALFYNADVDKGVGKMVELGVVWNYGESNWYGETVE